MRRRGLYASHVSYICIELHDGASMALWLAIAASPTAQISSPCGHCQLCRPGTLSSSCQALLPLSYMGVLRVGCGFSFVCVVQPSMGATLHRVLWSTPGILPGLLSLPFFIIPSFLSPSSASQVRLVSLLPH